MTFHQNLRLPLSGNKFILGLILLLALSSCSVFLPSRSAGQTDRTQIPVPRSTEVTPDELPTVVLNQKEDKITRISISDLIDWNEVVWNINYIIPTNAYYQTDIKANDSLDSYISFYEGFKIGLGKSNSKATAQLNVLNEENTVVGFQNPEFDAQKDFVIDICKEKNKFILSLKTPLDSAVVLNLNADMTGHIKAVSSFIKLKHTDGNLIVIHRNDRIESEAANLFLPYYFNIAQNADSNEIKTVKDKHFITVGFKQKVNSTLVLPKLKKGVKNIIYVSCYDEYFVRTLLLSLKSQIETYDIQIIGFPNWTNFNFIAPSILEEYNVILSSAMYQDEENTEYIDFKDQYLDLYAGEPLNDACIGYDYGLLVGKIIDQYQTKLTDSTVNRLNFKGIHNQIILLPKEDSYYLNQTVNLIQFKDYQFGKIE